MKHLSEPNVSGEPISTFKGEKLPPGELAGCK